MGQNDKGKYNQSREDAQHYSKIKRDAVLGMIRDALSYDGSDDGIRHSVAGLKQASDYMKDGWRTATEELVSPLMGLGNGHMTREDRDYCWQELKSAWDRVKDRQAGLKDANYAKIHEKLYRISDMATYGDPFEALKEIKAATQSMKGLRMDDSHYRSLRASFDEYWNKATARIEEKKREGASKRRKWESDMRDKISRLTAVRDKMSSFVDHQNSHRDKLRDQRDSARSSDFSNRVDGWIDEVDGKIRDALRSISDIEDKIRDIRGKLDS